MIDEKKLIEKIRNAINDDRYDGYKPSAVLFEVFDMILEAPKVGKWIPCSERLPDEEARQYIINNLDGIGYLYPCLLTYRSPNTENVHVVRFYYDIDMQCFVNHGEKMCEKARCIAWKPLPEPWEEE